MIRNVYHITIILSLFTVQSNPLLLSNFFRAYSNSLIINKQSSDQQITSVLTQCVVQTIDEEKSSESVHLKLNQKSDDLESEDINNKNQNEHFIKIHEYVRRNDSSIVLAATASGQGEYELEVFSIHVFGSNYTENAEFQLRENMIDLRLEGVLDIYVQLWRAGLLVTYNKDFPFDMTEGAKNSPTKFSSPLSGHIRRLKRLQLERKTTDFILSDFLKTQNVMKYQKNLTHNRIEALASLKEFAVWFRDEFPYYYHQCLHCGQKDGNSCYGLVFPSGEEQQFEAGRTELYICSNKNCGLTSRFPRFNAVHKILDTRRGRCGEYSILMMRMLQLLGYEAKWVVDWADHVWCEVFVDSSGEDIITDIEEHNWVHLDPCEASVNEPLIYQGWGKNQTYIVSYSSSNIDVIADVLVEDVTYKYTSRYNETVVRRLEDSVNQTFIDTQLLASKLELNKIDK
mmetsp:Transcript_24497/g.23524  ORF Transcript_24497/g.23524 Transcript_24497/m.23524 type:complete len:456 (+) Transcript_24497:119-1486(+)